MQRYCYYLFLILLEGCLVSQTVSPMPTKAPNRPLSFPQAQITPLLTPSSQLPTSLSSSPVPGGIALIPLPHPSSSPPQIFYNQRRALVLRSASQWVAVIGIPLDSKIGSHTVIEQPTGYRYRFQVINKKYPTQYIKLKNNRQVTPNPQELARIRRETEIIKAALATSWRPTASSPLPLQPPVQGRWSGIFGSRRYFNRQPRSPHRGVDIAAPLGNPVLASADGQVINTGHYFLNGKTILIDHGQGVVTLYCHLNDIQVTPGQTVQRGQPIGTVGKTGRATGPHLHWGVSLNNTLVDPKWLMETAVTINPHGEAESD